MNFRAKLEISLFIRSVGLGNLKLRANASRNINEKIMKIQYTQTSLFAPEVLAAGS